jgi:anti-sigma regulatory factor (Ser/Thr protein kinase)
VSAAELSLGADARSAGAARRFLTATLSTWGKTMYGDNATLLLSELVTNAALHAKTQIVVRIELRPACLLVSVTDGSPRQPVVRHYSDQSTTGRGLALVNALALRWGIDPNTDGTKTVWAEIEPDEAHRLPEDSTRDVGVGPGRDEGIRGAPRGSGDATALLRAA